MAEFKVMAQQTFTDHYASVSEAVGSLIQTSAMLELDILGAIWEFMGIQTLAQVGTGPDPTDMGWNGTEDEFEISGAPGMILFNLNALMPANAKIKLLKRCIEVARVEAEFIGLIKQLEKIFEVRNVVAHSPATPSPPDKGFIVVFGKSSRTRGLTRDTIDFLDLEHQIVSCKERVLALTHRFDQLWGVNNSHSGDPAEYVTMQDGLVVCRRCESQLEASTLRDGMPAWRGHVRSGDCSDSK